MNTNFDSKLFEKQINIDSCNAIMGGSTGCSETVMTGPSLSEDSRTTNYNEDGQITSVTECNYQ